MRKQDKKLRKKRARERDVQEKLQVRREVKRRKIKDLRKEAVEIAAYKKVINERVKLEQWMKIVEGKIPEDLQKRIEHNIQILKALEEEYANDKKMQSEARAASPLTNADADPPVERDIAGPATSDVVPEK